MKPNQKNTSRSALRSLSISITNAIAFAFVWAFPLVATMGCTNLGKFGSTWTAQKTELDQTAASAPAAEPEPTPTPAPQESSSVTTIPAGSTIQTGPDGSSLVKVIGAAKLKQSSKSVHYGAGPKAPTAAEHAAAVGLRWFMLAGLALALAAGIAGWLGHYLAAVKFGFGAIALPTLAYFFSEHVAIGVGIAAVGIGAGLILAWNSLNKKYNLEPKVTAAAGVIVPRVTGYIETDGKKLVAEAEAAIAKLKSAL
jgi:hypothetical protein